MPTTAQIILTHANEMRDELIACRKVLRDASRVLHHIPISAHDEILVTIAKIDRQLASLTYTIAKIDRQLASLTYTIGAP
jgi:hypothetical protein